MKILVFSDSHSGMSFMRWCVKAVRPDAVIHLGDHFDDGSALASEFPGTAFHQVMGNRDYYRCIGIQPELLCYSVGGVMLYMTHGHRQGVKQGLEQLTQAARERGAKAALFGHTHRALCRLEDGLWLINPGQCGSFSGSCALITTENNEITACRILTQADVEEML